MTGNDRPKTSWSFGKKDHESWADAIRHHLSIPQNWILPVAAVALTLGTRTFYQSYLRRLPASSHITHSFFRNRSLFGKVTSVGDGDGFHLFHTPGGRLAGWGWLRRVPKDKKQLKGQTVSAHHPPIHPQPTPSPRLPPPTSNLQPPPTNYLPPFPP